ncbi:MAG: branched-chain amino acid aminotransferase [Sphingomonadales bacterium]|nr:branched-chain amino acid aminotransferase [Sphingomonadales bacterium]
MDGGDTLEFRTETHASPVSHADRDVLLVDPGFGRVFTDHMAVIRFSRENGWHEARITARAPIPMDPATAVLHYAQEIFEGMKAYRMADGSAALFRADANARRFAQSAERMAMPPLPESIFLDSVRKLVSIDRDWIPHGEGGALYLRPFMFASEVFLGVRPANEYLFIVIASPVGAYFKGGPKAISLGVSRHFTRAAPGGTGAAKCGGNYASSLIAQAEAVRQGCDQVVFLDAAEHRWVEELGGMNTFFVFDDGSISTPPLEGTILPGITRESIIRLARDEGITVREERYSIDQWRADAESGHLREAFACGTAAVVTSIGTVNDDGNVFTIGSGGPGQLTERLRNRLVDIQRGVASDPHDWVERLF